MKKTFAFLVAAAVSLVSVTAFAQAPAEKNVLFKHWSIGAGFGDDVHVQVGTTLTPWLQMRLMYSTLTPFLAIAQPIVESALPGATLNPLHYSMDINYKSGDTRIDKIDIDGSVNWRDINLLFDFFPSQAAPVHITVGAIIGLNKNLIQAVATPTPALNPSDYTTTEIMGITTDKEGKIHMNTRFGLNAVKPYLGIGFGRPVTRNHRVGVNFDLGVAYVGGVHLYSQSYYDNPDVPKDVELNKAWVEANPDAKENLKQNDINTIDALNSFPIWPILRLSINVRLF